MCWKKIWLSSVGIENGLESSEMKYDTYILELAKSIRWGFKDMAIQDVQDSLVEEEIAETNLLEMTSELVN